MVQPLFVEGAIATIPALGTTSGIVAAARMQDGPLGWLRLCENGELRKAEEILDVTRSQQSPQCDVAQ
jgi:hypothetical protein